jgi:hypothetical protein
LRLKTVPPIWLGVGRWEIASSFLTPQCRLGVTLGHSAVSVQCPVCPKADTAERRATPVPQPHAQAARLRPRVLEQLWQRANVVNDPARDQRRAGSFVRCSAAPLLLHDDRRADLDPVIEIDHVLIGHTNAAR